METEIPPDTIVDLVARFCAYRGVATRTRFTVIGSLTEAVRITTVKGADQRWQTINVRGAAEDLPDGTEPVPGAAVERHLLERATSARDSRTPRTPWHLRHTVVSSSHFARTSVAIGRARALGLGWLLPANGEVLVVARPELRFAEGSSDVLHDDTGQPAVRWPDGTVEHYLQGARFTPSVYARVIARDLTLAQVAALPEADQRSVALTYLTFQRLVGQSGALLMDRGAKGTRLYRLRLPGSIRRDRPTGYGDFDYFIHMHDASHPEREFIEWVDPAVGRRGNAELCQAHAFGITLEQWLAITDEG